MKALLFLFSALLAIVLTPLAASAAECVERLEQIIEPLADKYGEAMMWRGIAEDGSGVQMEIIIFANPAGTTWTIVGHVNPEPWCVLSSGSGWQLPSPPTTGTEG